MSLFAVDVSVDRGCCEVKDGSPICPPGPDFQIDETVDYTRYMSRCARDLCNDSEGDEPQAPPPDGTCLVDDFACEIEDELPYDEPPGEVKLAQAKRACA